MWHLIVDEIGAHWMGRGATHLRLSKAVVVSFELDVADVAFAALVGQLRVRLVLGPRS